MAGSSEKRTIEILAKVTDLASRPLTTIGRGIKNAFVQGTKDIAGFAKQVLSMQSAMTALAGGFVAFRGSQLITGIVEATDELDKLARSTGSTVQRLLTLKNAFALQNVEGDRFKTVMSAVTKSISSGLTDGSGKAAKGLERLGLSLDDIKSNDPVQIFDRMSKALEGFATPQEKAAALLEVFPKMTSEISVLVDTLGQGQDAFRNLVATAEFFGGTMSDKGVAAVVRFDQALDVMRLSLERVGRSATVAIAERMAPLLERLATFMAQNGDRIGQQIGRVVAALSELVLKVSAAFLRLIAFLSSSGEKITEALEDIPLVGKKAADAIRGLFDTRAIVPGARAYRDQLAQMADQVEEFEKKARDGAQELSRMRAMPEEFGKDRIAEQMRKLEELESRRRDLVLSMVGVQDQFNAAQEAGGGKPQLDEISRQENAAKMRSFAGDISQLANFDSLPTPPTELSPIIKAMFGADGIPGAEQKTRGFFEGFAAGFDKVMAKWTDFAAAGEEAAFRLIDGGLNGITDAFADIVTGQKSAKEAFRDLAKTMLAELARIIAKLVIMKGLQTIGLGGAPGIALERGGVVPGGIERLMPVRRFEAGGVARRPTLALFGEGRASKGEAFVPLPDGRRIPVALMGGGGATMNITIQAMDGADVQRVLLNNRGTLRAVWQHDVSRVRAVRQSVRGAAR